MSTATNRVGRRGRRTAAPYAFLAPAVILFTLFVILPIGYAGYLSLRKVQVSGLGLGRGARKEIFAGLENYRDAVGDSELWSGGLRVLGYGALLVPIMLGLALLFALLLDRPRARFGRFARTSIFLPYAVPAIIASLLWGFLYLPATSPVNDLLAWVGLPEPDLLGQGTVFYSVVNIALWGGIGFNMIVLYTALRAIPVELYESARLDGCSEVQIALRIKIPLLVPALVMTTVFSMIATLQVFIEPMALEPLTNSISSTWTPLMKVYRDAFATNDRYAAAATSVLIAAITLVLSFGFLRLVQNRAFGQER
ncbi:carbohydrate ABC transporter permease [Plantactinospora soyae]|uniref:Multiple sugar transport system permease protein n=1 Tax=Plantactinospora soyae TaxID=1544732 RepID=A0A927QXB3_9ACTN|nr:sugar ABC transporter permease [Plantactinospora soyae]MBE1487875.1 multiple sugar transport system permease protein [Plantactinospora soyae]